MDLARGTYLFLDCQTTGLSFEKSQILELGWCLALPGEPARIETRLFRLTEPESVPTTVWRMTGLQASELESAGNAEEAWEALLAQVPPGAVTAAIIHYAQFEMPFLRALHAKVCPGDPFPWPVICTYRLSRKIFPELPARTLRAMSGHFGFDLPEEHRSQNHVAATLRIWENTLEALRGKELPVDEVELWKWLAASPAKSKTRSPRKYLTPRDERLDLPETPGVYEFLSSKGKILYIGKATCLRDRVNSYYRQRRSTRAMLNELMTQVRDIRITQTATALEAALLENDRIKCVQPPYNSSLRASRELVFSSTHLEELSPSRDARHPWGPFASSHPFESLERLLWIQRGELEKLELELLKHSPQEMKQALETLLASLGFAQPTAPRLADLHRAGKRRLPPLEEGDELGESLQRKLRRPVQLLHHAHWLAWLTESEVSWRVTADPEERWRHLHIRGGVVVESGEGKSENAKFPRVPFYRRQSNLDHVSLDRMRILLTELGVLHRKGVPLEVALSATRRFYAAPTAWTSRVLGEALAK